MGVTGRGVRLSHERIHAKDCEDCETKKGMLDEIHSKIHLEGDLDEAQRKRFLEIATLCPVHHTLSSEIKIQTAQF
jgi:putative redox protein